MIELIFLFTNEETKEELSKLRPDLLDSEVYIPYVMPFLNMRSVITNSGTLN